MVLKLTSVKAFAGGEILALFDERLLNLNVSLKGCMCYSLSSFAASPIVLIITNISVENQIVAEFFYH